MKKSLIYASTLLSLACAAEPLPSLTFEPLGMGSFRLNWQGSDEFSHFVQYSVDLQNWLYLPEIPQGVVHDPLDFTPTY